MGLSGPKRRTAIAADPNNTAWSKSTKGFGHKILSAQGWKPGQLLGAENAAQAEHYTAANASHIRVMLREDNLGLGAKLGKNNAETFGLSTLSGIFGRLNGKSDAELEKMKNAQRDVELRTYQTRKFGQMTFVRGGLLVGDKMEDDSTTRLQPEQRTKIELVSQTPPDNDSQSCKERRKHDDMDGRKKKKRKLEDYSDDTVVCKEKKMKGTKEGKKERSPSSAEQSDHRHDEFADAVTIMNPTTHSNDEKAARAVEKAEKRARKEARRIRKEERASRKAERQKRKSMTTSHGVKSTTAVASNESMTIPASTVAFGSSRQAFRQRFMQHKRLAVMDSRALNEILMLKPTLA